jgi:hypothetical protein
VPESPRTSKKAPEVLSGGDLNRIFALLKANLEEIQREQPGFYGTLRMEINFREGQIETLAVERRQTLKY